MFSRYSFGGNFHRSEFLRHLHTNIDAVSSQFRVSNATESINAGNHKSYLLCLDTFEFFAIFQPCISFLYRQATFLAIGYTCWHLFSATLPPFLSCAALVFNIRFSSPNWGGNCVLTLTLNELDL